LLRTYHLFSSRQTSSYRTNQERLNEGRKDEQRESNFEEHPDPMNDLVSKPCHVTLSYSLGERHTKP